MSEDLGPSAGGGDDVTAGRSDGLPEFPRVRRLELDQLLGQLVERAQDVIGTQSRLRGLLAANQAVVSDLSLSAVLRHIVEAARTLVGAKYAALGVLGHGRLVEFVHVGMEDGAEEIIGPLPEGRGILGVLTEDPRPLRLADLTSHPDSYGFPPNHPPMRTFLGVPIRLGDRAFGNLYLTEKEGEAEFTAEDEELVVALAASAAVAIAHAQLFAEAERRQRWLSASGEITRRLLSPTPAGDDGKDDVAATVDPLTEIASLAAEVAGTEMALVLVPDSDGGLVVGAAVGWPEPLPVGTALGATAFSDVIRAGEPHPVEDGASLVSAAGIAGHDRAGPAMVVPMKLGTEAARALLLVRTKDGQPFTEAEAEMAAGFAEQASLAYELADAQVQVAEAARLRAVLNDRDRIARDLHDVIIQRVYAAGLAIHSFAARYVSDSDATERLSSLVDELDEVIRQLRSTIYDLHRVEAGRTTGSDLREQIRHACAGLKGALGFSPTVRLVGPIDDLVPKAVAEHVVPVITEALTNVARHANATSAAVEVTVSEESGLVLRVVDDGKGLGRPERASGTANMAERARQLGGQCTVGDRDDDRPGTEVRWLVPIGG